MMLRLLLGVVFVLLSGYYAAFFVARQEPTTLLQVVMLLSAAGWLILEGESRAVHGAWFRGWLPIAWQAWAVLGATLALAVLLFVVMDRDSHSASDTLQRIAPSYALLLALVVRLRAARSLPGSTLG